MKKILIVSGVLILNLVMVSQVAAQEITTDYDVLKKSLASSEKVNAKSWMYSLSNNSLPVDTGLFTYAFDDASMEATIVKYNDGGSDTINIPSQVINDNKVYTIKKIDPNSFEGTGVKKVVIPTTIEVVKNDAFSRCSNLSEIIFEETESEVEPNLAVKRASLGYQTPNVKKIIFPKRLKEIEYAAFSRSDIHHIQFKGKTVPFVSTESYPKKKETAIKSIRVEENTSQKYIDSLSKEWLNLSKNEDIYLTEGRFIEDEIINIKLNSEVTLPLPDSIFQFKKSLNEWKKVPSVDIYKDNKLIASDLKEDYTIKSAGISEHGEYSIVIHGTNEKLYSLFVTSSSISFDTDGGTPTPQPIYGKEGTIVNLDDIAEPKKEGFTFGGWYFNNKKYSGKMAIPDNNIPLKATWYQEGTRLIDETTQFPYSSIAYLSNPGARGSAVVVGRDYVLTAAHCFRKDGNDSSILPGSFPLEGESYPFGVFKIDAANSTASPDYVGGQPINDFALVKVFPRESDGKHIGDVVKPLTVLKDTLGKETQVGQEIFLRGYPTFADHRQNESIATITRLKGNSRIDTATTSSGGNSGGGFLNDVDQLVGVYHGAGTGAGLTGSKYDNLLEWGLSNEKNRLYFTKNKEEWEIKRKLIKPEGNYLESQIGSTVDIKDKKPVKEGYEFYAWFDGSREYKEDQIDMPIGGTTLYPLFKAEEHTIRFDAKGGTTEQQAIVGKTDEVIDFKHVKEAKKEGFTFLGWYNGNDKIGESLKMPAKDVDYIAKWKDNNSLTGEVANQKKETPLVVEIKNNGIEIDPLDPTDPNQQLLNLNKVPTQYNFETTVKNVDYSIDGTVTDGTINVFNDRIDREWSVKASVKDNSFPLNGKNIAVTSFKINAEELLGTGGNGIVAKAQAEKTAGNNTGTISTEINNVSIKLSDTEGVLKGGDTLNGTISYQLYNTANAE